MPNNVLRLVVPGADFSGVGLGKHIALPSLGGLLYAGYMLGTTWGADPTLDRSGNNRTLTKNNNPTINAAYVDTVPKLGSGTLEKTLSTPFAADAFGGAGGITLIGVYKPNGPSDKGLIVSSYNPAAARQFSIGKDTTDAGRAYITLGSGVAVAGGYTTPADTTTYGSDHWEFLAGGVDEVGANIYRRNETMSAAVVASGNHTTAQAAPWGDATRKYTIGSGYALGDQTTIFSAQEKIAAALFYAKRLSNAEIDSVYASLKSMLSGVGVSI